MAGTKRQQIQICHNAFWKGHFESTFQEGVFFPIKKDISRGVFSKIKMVLHFVGTNQNDSPFLLEGKKQSSTLLGQIKTILHFVGGHN
jgi:hypothetical protein